MTHNTEQVLVAQCKAGDHAAFAELIQRSTPVTIRAIRAIAANGTDAEDIMQETLLKAYRGIGSFKGESKFSTWLTRIAINNALLFLRRKKRQSEVSLDAEAGEGDIRLFELTDRRANQEQVLIRDQATATIRRAVYKLPAQLRRYATRRYLDELPHGMVALEQGITMAAGKSRSMRARKLLESTLAPTFRHPA